MRECPRCKGSGAVADKRVYAKNLDPFKKCCPRCKQMLDRITDFYKGTGYCKPCHNKKIRLRPYLRANRYKIENDCLMCGLNFMGYKKNQPYCSKQCNMKAINIRHSLNRR